jgi:hypothetical protein
VPPISMETRISTTIVIWRRLRASLFRLTGPWPRLELVGLKAFSHSPLNLARFDDRNWMTTDKPIWFIAEHLCGIPHISLLTQAMEKNLTRVDQRTFRGEMMGRRKK